MLTSLEINAQEKVKFSKEELKTMDDDLFDEMFVGISSKKNTTIVFKDGRKTQGTASNLKRKKGQILSIDLNKAVIKSKHF